MSSTSLRASRIRIHSSCETRRYNKFPNGTSYPLSNDTDQCFVAYGTAEGDADLEVAFGVD